MLTAHVPPFPAHSEPADTCTGCQHRLIVGKAPAAWSYCNLHITPRAKCANYDPAGAPVPTNRLAGGLQCK